MEAAAVKKLAGVFLSLSLCVACGMNDCDYWSGFRLADDDDGGVMRESRYLMNEMSESESDQ
jgi:hypothetical protein